LSLSVSRELYADTLHFRYISNPLAAMRHKLE
jgi:hypothetical protein